jgi:hypothetical protein
VTDSSCGSSTPLANGLTTSSQLTPRVYGRVSD